MSWPVTDGPSVRAMERGGEEGQDSLLEFLHELLGALSSGGSCLQGQAETSTGQQAPGPQNVGETGAT